MTASVIAGGYTLFMQKNSASKQVNNTKLEYAMDIEDNATASQLNFTIQDQDKKPLSTGLEEAHGESVHVYVVSSNGSDYRHLHPHYEKKTEKYMLHNLKEFNQGKYRIHASFTPNSSEVNNEGSKKAVNLHRNVTIGKKSSGANQAQTVEKLEATSGDLTARVFEVPNDGGGKSVYVSGITNTLAFSVLKNEVDYKDFAANSANLVVFSPTGELVQTKSAQASSTKSALVGFTLTYPDPGVYTAFLELKDKGKIKTFSFNIGVN